MDPFLGDYDIVRFDHWLPSLERATSWGVGKAPGHLRGRALQEWKLIPLEEKSTYTDAVTVLRSRVDPENWLARISAIEF